VRQYPATPVVGYVTITAPPPASLVISDTYQMAALVSTVALPVPTDPALPSQIRELTDRTVVWGTSNAAVATVSGSGVVTAIGVGSCTITATCEGVSAAVAVAVVASPAAVATVTVSPATLPLSTGGTFQVSAVVKNASGQVLLGRTVTWGTANAAVATVSADSGDDNHTATVTAVGAGGPTNITATCESVPGAVAVTVTAAPSGSEFVTFADPKVAFILGPLLVDGSTDNPWAQFDTKAKATGLEYGTKAPSHYPRSTLTGTVSISNGSPTLTGSGTSFLTQVGLYNRLYVNDAGTFRGPVFASSIDSDTQITLTANWPHTTVSGGAWKSNGTDSGLTDSSYFDSFTHYYDLAQSMYILYYRTGDTAYRALARTAADAWYSGRPNGGVGSGDYGIAPREGFMAGLMLRALDGRPEMWDFIERWVDYQFNAWVWLRRNNSTLYYGVRDGAFALLYSALLASILPDTYRNTADTANVDGVARRAHHLSRVTQVVALYYDRLQDADGGFYWDDGDFGGDYGAVVFHWGYLLEAFIATHKLIRDNATYATEKATLKAMITELCDCIWARAWRADTVPDNTSYKWRGLWYSVFRADEARSPSGSVVTGGDLNVISEVRQLTCMVIHAFGYLYHLAADVKYLTQGDEMFSASYGYGAGPAADSRGCLLDSFDTASYKPPTGRVRGKEYNQAVRSAGKYLARRVGSTD